jgi:hypothetical protein
MPLVILLILSFGIAAAVLVGSIHESEPKTAIAALWYLLGGLVMTVIYELASGL